MRPGTGFKNSPNHSYANKTKTKSDTATTTVSTRQAQTKSLNENSLKRIIKKSNVSSRPSSGTKKRQTPLGHID